MLALFLPASLFHFQILEYFDIVFTTVFTVEIVLKVWKGWAALCGCPGQGPDLMSHMLLRVWAWRWGRSRIRSVGPRRQTRQAHMSTNQWHVCVLQPEASCSDAEARSYNLSWGLCLGHR